jgi:hypothetical protein
MMIERTDDHRYFFVDARGRHEALGVTRTLIEANLVDDEYFNDLGRGRGKLVHEFAERLATNTLSKPIDVSALGYMRAFRRFLDEYGPEVHGAEVVLGHVARRLAGTCDLDVVMRGSKAVVDIKTGSPSDWHGLQLAPYAFLLDGVPWMKRARFGLYLKETGGFRIKEYDEISDLDYFFRAHELLHWRVNHGSFEKPYGRKPIAGVGDYVAGRGSSGTGIDDVYIEDGDGRDRLYGDPAER